MDRDSNFSCILSKAMDTLGYSFEAIIRRIEHYDHFNECIKASLAEYSEDDSFHVSFNLAGSKREGISLPLEGDYDIMFILDDIKCINKDAAHQYASSFKLIQDDVPNGYTKLVKLQLDSDSDNFNDFSEYLIYDPVSKFHYLSSKRCMGNSCQLVEHTAFYVCESKSPAGPSTPIKITPKVFHGLEIESDVVTALSFIHSDDLITFCSRERCYRFPSPDLLDEISQMEGQIVPVGHKNSDDQDLQWRICYTLVEIKLIQSFNATQFQLYVVLKMLAKQVLKPVCQDITSYVVKNIVLWIIEVTPGKYFQTENLSKLIVRSMLFLKTLVSEGYVPNYMIPVRNLIAGKILPWTKLELFGSLSCLLDRGESMVLECPEIEKEMIVIFNNPNIYRPRLEERNLYVDFMAQLMATCSKISFQRLESVKAFTDEIVQHFPMATFRKVMEKLSNVPGYVENSACFLNKPLVVETSQQLKYTPENINTANECILSNAPKAMSFMVPLVEKTTELLNSNTELIQKIMPSDECLRLFTNLASNGIVSNGLLDPNRYCELLLSNPEILCSLMTPEHISKIQQHLLPLLFKIVSENPQILKDCIRFESETNFAQAMGEDNIQLLLSANLRAMDVEDSQRIINDPAYQEYLNKMLKGLSM